MLFLLFQIGNDRYAIEANRVVEVAPLLELQRLPHAPRGVAGVVNYRGNPVPAVDFSQLVLGQPAAERLSTRIIIVKHPDGQGREQLLGIIAEKATDLLHKDAADFGPPAGQGRSAPYLGPVFVDDKGPVQCLREQQLLPEPVRDVLFAEPADAPGRR